MSSPHAALIVDTDPKGLESLVYGFQGAEWRMTACPSPETASLLVKASGAQVVVIASRTAHDKTYSLLRQLRGKEATRGLPVLVLGPEELRQPLKDGGGAELLPLPTFVRDVLSASEILVAAATAPTTGDHPCVQTALTSAKTLSLLRTMNGLASSGQLKLERHGRTGEILFHQGTLTAASIGALQGMPAVQHLLIWNDGAIELRLRQVPRRGQLLQAAQEFMLELDRFQRDYNHGMKDLGPPTTVYTASQERLAQAGAAVPTEVTPVVRLCNGSRTLADVIDESPFRVLDTVRILGRLAELTILARADGKPVIVGSHAAAGADVLDARITDSGAAWPMPEPIGAPATPEAASGETPDQGAAAPRPRRQTLEIGLQGLATSSATPATAPTPTAAAAPPPASQSPSRPSAKPAPVAESIGQALASLGANQAPTPAPAPATAPVPIVQAAMQTSGVIESRPQRHTQRNMPAAGTRHSVVIDVAQTMDVKTPPAGAPATPTKTPAAPPAQVVIVGASSPAARPEPRAHVAVTPAPAAPPVASPAPSAGSTGVAGELQVTPSRRTAAQAIPVVRPSIQLDTSLAAPVATPAPASAMQTQGARVTGEMHVASSGRSTRAMDKPAAKPSSFQVDPSLSEPSSTQHSGAEPAAPARTDSRPVPLKRSDSRPIPGPKTRPSGNFSTIETDFFEREADLYKEEKTESFADLDEGKGGGKGKDGGKGKGGKPGRPPRK
jgi:hypothetical protein